MSTLNYSLIVASSNSRKFHHYISRLSQWKLMKRNLIDWKTWGTKWLRRYVLTC